METASGIVVVTGFGPFRQYVSNSSWEVAKDLRMTVLGLDIQIHIKEIPVSYEKSKQVIDDIWQKLTPKLVIHLGIASGAKGITLEQTAKNYCYKDRDVTGQCPADHYCIQAGPEQLHSIIDMRSLSKQLKRMGLDVIYSRDAGRYLCDFVYYYSLYRGKGMAALIHIPAKESRVKLVPLLQTIIQTLLLKLGDLDKTSSWDTTVKIKYEDADC
ncbi:hypothetical protein DNTS_003352 [Danionella cerebrum]|uniref:Pyroglutamyl-peptidase I like n=1 Tax=Danionella cerebrum TaxID=2873325 RepID=A0A553NLR9_9TELE|nr:hypothetical protein DNTS_003352 [Danionella translucida]